MSISGLLFALPMTVIGAWYVFHAGSVSGLATREGERANRIRVRLRRMNGVLIVLSGFLLYFVISRVQLLTQGALERPGLALPIAVLALVPLVVLMLVLAWLDMRLTRRLKRVGPLRDTDKAAPALLVAAGLFLTGCGDDTATADTTVQQAEEPAAASEAMAPDAATSQPPASRPAPQDLPTVEQPLGNTTFTLMIADDADEREKGLMYRREMGRDEGMAFAFPDDGRRSFWMANTLLPLDILYIDAGGKVLNLYEARPLDRVTRVPSDGPCRYVIELHRGRAAEAGIGPGSVLDLAPLINAATPR